MSRNNCCQRGKPRPGAALYLAFGALVAVAGITASCVVAAALSLVTCAWGLATPVLRDAQRVVARPASR
ncbi:MAG: hypothetical protein M3Q84_03150 [Actinomycetota bacterium]|nr:hypothetical protein [Actinomycetota bacterium]